MFQLCSPCVWPNTPVAAVILPWLVASTRRISTLNYAKGCGDHDVEITPHREAPLEQPRLGDHRRT